MRYLLILALALGSCRMEREIIGIVRDADGARPAGIVKVELYKQLAGGPELPVDDCSTTAEGFFGFPKQEALIAQRRADAGTQTHWLRFTPAGGVPGAPVAVSGYRGFYHIRLPGTPKAPPPPPVADMHYHISQRVHNHTGAEVHDKSEYHNSAPVPSDLTWYADKSALEVFHDGKWQKAPKVCWSELQAPGRSAAFAALFEQGLVRAKRGNNKLTQYSQATHPHVRDGGVKLAYNAISPFEHNLNQDPFTRWLSRIAKTGIRTGWSSRLGGDAASKRTLTHWENFRLEHAMMNDQDPTIEGVAWQFLQDGSDIVANPGKTFVVTSVEGGHFLQDDLFPNRIDRDLAGRDEVYQSDVLRIWKQLADRGRLDAQQQADVQRALDLNKQRSKLKSDKLADDREEQLKQLNEDLFQAVDDALLGELRRNMAELRTLDPPVHMVTVSHLSHNGMTGHAPALDDGGWFLGFIARKVYNMRLSRDPSYLSQWGRLYFTVPGVNIYGSTLMRGLTTPVNGRRIMLDLKHSDLVTRHFFYDSIMVKNVVPPICSHCGVTGMSERYWSPFNNEYNLLKDPMVRTFYPFGINLYDEEVVIIHRNNGIIGIPLEQRILGGYIDKRVVWNMHITGKGKLRPRVKANPPRTKRSEHSRRLFRWLDGPAPAPLPSWVGDAELMAAKADLNTAVAHTTARFGLSGAAATEATAEEFISLVPFIQNLIYILDRILDDIERTDPRMTKEEAMRLAWSRVCIGSDLDGLIDPMDVVPTAGQYPEMRVRLQQFIPLFLHFRRWENPTLIGRSESHFRTLGGYTCAGFSLDEALNALFYDSLKDFTVRYTTLPPQPCGY